MKIEVEKEYITADGNIVLILYYLGDCDYNYQDNMGRTYTETGTYCCDGISYRDLICEVVPSIYVLYKSGRFDIEELIKQHIEYYTK